MPLSYQLNSLCLTDITSRMSHDEFECGAFSIPFPYKPYTQQLTTMQLISEAIDTKAIAIVESPTGTGKTQCLLNSALALLTKYRERSKKLRDDNDSGLTVGQFFKTSQILNGRRSRLHGKVLKRSRSASSEEEDVMRSGGSDSSSDDADDQLVDFPKLFYTSRTHSQLAQSMREAATGPFFSKPEIYKLKMVHVASRQQLCVNQKIRARSRGQQDRLNDLCIEALGEPSTCERGCPYADKHRVNVLVEHLRIQPRSLSEIKTIGEREKGCPFLATKRFTPEANVIFLPYGYLTDKSMREQCCGPTPVVLDGCTADDFDDVKKSSLLTGATVIFDEGHNLGDAASSALSADLSTATLKVVEASVAWYASHYQNRLLQKNKQKLRELLGVLRSLLAFNPLRTGNDHRVMGINEFIFDCGLDDVNFFSISQFIENSNLRQKLRGAASHLSTVGKPEMLNDQGISVACRFIDRFARADSDASAIIAEREESGLLFRLVASCSAPALRDVLALSRSIVVAGGTLQPFPLLCADLFPRCPTASSPRCSPPEDTEAEASKQIKIGAFDHVIPSRNLQVLTLRCGPSKEEFLFTFAQRGIQQQQLREVGDSLLELAKVVPHGMAVFFPSYAMESMFVDVLKRNGTFTRIEDAKKIFRESPTTPAEETLKAYTDYLEDHLESGTGAMIFCVMGGKLSEGVNFNDHLARCVVVVGMPYPNPQDPLLRLKMDYVSKDGDKSKGQLLYQSLCMRSVNQSIGRCVRHIADYATVVLLDARYRSPGVAAKLPRWMQPSLIHAEDFASCLSSVKTFFSEKR